MSNENAVSKKIQFKAEIKQLLDILVHSLYTSREIFLREIISNASDALDKLRFESTRGTDIADAELALDIHISFNEKKKIITITDTGIGMTREELIENIGTIAKSGSAEFIKQLEENKSDVNNIIGKFGVGFYSVFMVAKEVVLRTKSFRKDSAPLEWRSDGLGSYEISEVFETIQRGTTIEIHLKDDAAEFAEKYRLESIIKKHSNFISFPIYLDKEKINTIAALWRENKSSVTKEQYIEFYKFLTHDYEEPMEIIHNSVDAPIQFNTLLFIPKKNYDFFGMNREDYGLDLYVRRVLIQHKNKDLLPEYLGFVKGVVDSEDLPLNISRETLQENMIFSKIAHNVTGQVLSYLIKKAKDEPEKYLEFWKEHGKVLKIGYNDFANREKYIQLLRFNSSNCTDAEQLISLEDYESRLKEDQKEIYFALGNSRDAIALDPHIEIFRKKGIEILYLYDPIDEFIISSLGKFKDFDFRSVDSVDLKNLDKYKDEIKKENTIEPLGTDDEKHFDSLMSKIKDILGDRITEVRKSERLIDSAACLVSTEDSITASMQRLMRLANKETTAQKKIFEVNKDHKLIRNLVKIFKQDPNDAYIEDVVFQLFESAQLMEGTLMEPHKLVQRLNQLLEQSSSWYTEVKKID